MFQSPGTPANFQGSFNANGTITPGSTHNVSLDNSMLMNGMDTSGLAVSPVVPPKEVVESLVRPKNFIEKARVNAG